MNRPLIASVAILSVLVLSSCVAQPDDDQGAPYASQFAQAQEQATTPFERDVLADGEISRAEYEEAMQRYVECVRDRGADVTLRDQTGYYIYEIGADTALYDRVAPGCSAGVTELIEPLFVDTFTNPQNLEFDAAIAECFVALGLVDEPFTQQDFRDLLASAGATSTGDSESGQPVDPRAQAILASADADHCMANPSYHLIFDDGE